MKIATKCCPGHAGVTPFIVSLWLANMVRPCWLLTPLRDAVFAQAAKQLLQQPVIDLAHQQFLIFIPLMTLRFPLVIGFSARFRPGKQSGISACGGKDPAPVLFEPGIALIMGADVQQQNGIIIFYRDQTVAVAQVELQAILDPGLAIFGLPADLIKTFATIGKINHDFNRVSSGQGGMAAGPAQCIQTLIKIAVTMDKKDHFTPQ
ncbi:MAG: hypothetical protein L3J03_09475 [Desulfobacterales bacterium]|nr:hypothetical protein [Desulfobacterales bacterium]